MKKNMGLFFGIVAIVFAALIFGGCEQSTGGESSTPPVQAPAPTADVGIVGTEVPVQDGTVVTLTAATEGARIYYTDDGTDPTSSSPQYTEGTPITINGDAGNTVTIKAIEVKDATSSGVLTVQYKIDAAATPIPTVDIPSGTVADGDSVTLSADEGLAIYYTLNGANPTTSSQQYEAPVQINAADAQDGVVTLKAIAVKGEVSSAVRTVEYRIGAITWTAVANGEEDKTTSTAITITFTGGSVTDLREEHITVINGTGEAAKTTLDGNSLGINVTKAGTVSLRIRKAGIVSEPTDGPVTVYKTVDVPPVTGIVWTASAYGTTGIISSKFIVLDFSGQVVTGLTAEQITVASDDESDTPGEADKGVLIDSGTGYSLAITVQTEGDLLVTIEKEGIDDTPHTVRVYKDSQAPGQVTGTGWAAVDAAEKPSYDKITLTWTNPVDEDFDHVEISCIATDPAPAAETEPVIIDNIKGSTHTVGDLAASTQYTFNVISVDSDGNKSEPVGITEAKTEAKPKASVTVKFSGFEDEAIDLIDADGTADGTALSWSGKEVLTVSLEEIDGSYSCEYSLDESTSRESVTGKAITLKANELSVKTHTLTVFVTKGGVTHTKRLTFKVEA
ncbi:MAG: chitobiase/beta-hexosaminidase C-terminal domain-containing protein [Spirochaetaceae bacterium]|jgi:hypothetical protein|nr:chitobiase/beta-hexosaminidase C-terminal domain-containing protein [Spirochaetaceae bacterium]